MKASQTWNKSGEGEVVAITSVNGLQAVDSMNIRRTIEGDRSSFLEKQECAGQHACSFTCNLVDV
eukprot:scaffold28223_cov78-Skeletonema_dohrnii-CCMP3373.AAC.1